MENHPLWQVGMAAIMYYGTALVMVWLIAWAAVLLVEAVTSGVLRRVVYLPWWAMVLAVGVVVFPVTRWLLEGMPFHGVLHSALWWYWPIVIVGVMRYRRGMLDRLRARREESHV